MTTLIAFHDVEDGAHWANAWKKDQPGNRHEMFAKVGVTARLFRDARNPNSTGLIFEVPDMDKFEAFMQTDEARQAMAEDKLKVDTIKILTEFTP